MLERRRKAIQRAYQDLYVCAVNVYLPKDRVTNMHQQYGFVEYRGEEDADYVSCNLCHALYACCKVQ